MITPLVTVPQAHYRDGRQNGVWAFSANNVWFSGYTVSQWNGTTATELGTGSMFVSELWAVSPQAAFGLYYDSLQGPGSALYKFDGTT